MNIFCAISPASYSIDICATCDENRSVMLETAIDSMAVNAMFLKSIRIDDFRYASLYKTVVDNYQKTSINLKAWGYNRSFCRGKCKKNLYKEYKKWMRTVKSILDSKKQELFENVENQDSLPE